MSEDNEGEGGDDNNNDGMMFMVPDILVARMEEARRIIWDMKNADVQQREFLFQAARLLIDSCDVRYAKLNIPRGDNVTPIN